MAEKIGWVKHNEYRVTRVKRLLQQCTLSNTTIPSEMMEEVKQLVDHLIFQVNTLEEKLAAAEKTNAG
jgi:hypothetical protein